MVNPKVLFGAILTLFLLSPTVFAQAEYNYSAGFDFTPRDIFSNYYYQYSPKVACDPDYNHCAAVIFQNNAAFGRAVKLYYTTQGFTETNWLGFPNTERYTFANSEYAYNDDGVTSEGQGALNITRDTGWGSIPLGYDIWYEEASQQYWIVISSRANGGEDTGTYCSRYTFQAGRSPEILGPYGCGTYSEGYGTGVGAWQEWGGVFGIFDKDSNQPYYVVPFGYCHSSVGATCNGNVRLQAYYLLNNTFIDGYAIWASSCSTNQHPIYGDGRFYGHAGIFPDDFSTQKRDAIFSFGCGTVSDRCNFGFCGGTETLSLGSFPTTQVGFNYYNNPLLYYLRDDYLNATSIWRTSTTDFNSYSDTAVYYVMNSTLGEYINASSEHTSTSSQWVYEYKSFATGNLTRSVAYDVELFPVEITARYFTPNVDYLLLNPASITATLNCPSGFSTSGTGDQFTLGSQCTDDVEFIVDTFLYRPTHAENTIDIPEGCDDYLLRYYFIAGDYQMPIEVRNDLTGEVIPNATVYVGASSNTTNADGIAYFNVQPLSGAYFIEDQVSCRSTFNPYGTPKTYTIRSEHGDFLDWEEQDEFAYFNEDNETKYLPLYQIYMVPDAAIVEVHVRTQDGIEITPTNTRMYGYGAEDTWIQVGEASFNVNYLTEFPGTFIFRDNRSSFPINFTYEYFGEIYYRNQTVIKGTVQSFFFEVPRTSFNSSCLTSDDCLPSFCVDSTFAQLIGCNIPEGEAGGVCEYSYESCVACDELIGCYELPTTTPCADHMDCLNLSYCVGLSKSKTALCGSGEVCLYKDIICKSPDFCDEDLVITNVTGTPITAGMCRTTFLCVLTGGVREKFTIRVPTNNIEYTLTGEPWKDVVDIEYGCTIETAGTRTCIDGYHVSEAEAEIGIATFPENWAYDQNATDGIDFYDIAVTCSDGCEITYEYCPHGCAGGVCLTAPLSPEATARNWIQALSAWWWVMFPTIWDAAFMWVILSLLGSFGLAGGLAWIMSRGGGGGGSMGGQEIGSVFIGSAIAFFLLGTFIGTMPLFISVIFAILGGFLVWTIWK